MNKMFLIAYNLFARQIRLLIMDTPDVKAKTAARIKELRSEHGLTQDKFALMVGLNRSYLADIEKGNRNFGIETLDKIVTGFGITYAEFFETM